MLGALPRGNQIEQEMSHVSAARVAARPIDDDGKRTIKPPTSPPPRRARQEGGSLVFALLSTAVEVPSDAFVEQLILCRHSCRLLK